VTLIHSKQSDFATLPGCRALYHAAWAIVKHCNCLTTNDNPDLWLLVILLVLQCNALIQLIEDHTVALVGLLRTVVNFHVKRTNEFY